MSHIEKRKDRYLAVLTIPEDLRHHFNGKIRHVKSTGTGDKNKAQAIAFRLVADWKEEFSTLRGETPITDTTALDTALALRQHLQESGEAGDEFKITAYDQLKMVIEDIVEQKTKAGDGVTASAIYNIALMGQEPVSSYLDDWEAQLHVKPKQVERMRKDAELLCDYFPYLSDITALRAREWAQHLMAHAGRDGKGVGVVSVERIFGAARSVWQYLQEIGKVPDDLEPLKTPAFVKRQKIKQGKDSWVPFTQEEVVLILKEATKSGDQPLADLVELGMYTGARINELCSLKCSDCSEDVLSITDSKTYAGIREVPVHSALRATVKRLLETSKDGYLLTRLPTNKYGSRSDAIGKRFGRLKVKMGFPSLKVFHSIRKTVITMLENEGVTENLTADIVGHDKPRITYGLYSDGHSIEKKREAVELLVYS